MIQDHINPSALRQVFDDLGKLLCLVIDHMGGTQGSNAFCFFCRCRDEQWAVGVQSTTQLNSGRVDAPSTPMEQHTLTVFKPGELKEIKVCRDIGFADTCRLCPAQSIWYWHQMARPCKRQFGVSTTAHKTHHPIPFLPLRDALSYCRDGSSHLQPEHIRLSLGRRVVTLPLDKIGSVNAGGNHANQHLTGPRERVVPFTEIHYVSTAKGLLQNRFHFVFSSGNIEARASEDARCYEAVTAHSRPATRRVRLWL